MNSSPKYTFSEYVFIMLILASLGVGLVKVAIQEIFFQSSKNDFVEYNATLEWTPRFVGGRGSRLVIYLLEKREFSFVIDNQNFPLLKNSKWIDSLKHGDSVSVLIEKKEFLAKINKSVPATFSQQIFNWNEIVVFGFKNDKYEFLNYFDVKKELKQNSKILFVIGLIMLIVAYFTFKVTLRDYRKSKEF